MYLFSDKFYPSARKCTKGLPGAVLVFLAGLSLHAAPALAQVSGAATGGTAVMVPATLPQTSGFRQALAAAASGDEAVQNFFRDRGYESFWTSEGPEGITRRAALLAALDGAAFHALPVARYDAAGLRRAFAQLRSEGDRGRLEIRMTRALLDYARDLSSGVLTPARIDPGIVRSLPRPEEPEVLAAFAADPQRLLNSLSPRNPEYVRLLRARADLQRQIAGGGWGRTIAAKSLRPGSEGPEVVALRDRLAAMGYLGRSATASYDGSIVAAVRAFQEDQGLSADGVAGEATLRALNTAAEERLAAVTVAIERERWANIPRGDRHIWVNLTDYTVKLIDDGKVSFETRAVIGSTKDEKRTPEFSHRMTYLEVNPDWTVPPGIIRRDYLPKLQANPNALGHLKVVDSRGREIPRSAINFSAYTARNFPFSLKQPPGPSNALGRVKFMFPNPWSIYLHDTPDKHLFARDARAFSSGCVRLNDPFDFAYALLARQSDDPKGLFQRVLNSGKQTRINLEEPVPVHLDYRTAFSDARGKMQYRRDIYGRDAAIHAALIKAGVTP
ncbi:L,D-transpeptidase family protein [Falsigemmobacter intermedius]|uniref:L,D-transpeptidase family protein n=1 Tax=Falsigemmobacter intermedius TaxID=1553448 RepID=UPI003F06E0A5